MARVNHTESTASQVKVIICKICVRQLLSEMSFVLSLQQPYPGKHRGPHVSQITLRPLDLDQVCLKLLLVLGLCKILIGPDKT